MKDENLLRYSRHILLPQLDVAGQEKLLQARVLIVGLGGLGSPVAMYLASSGVGHLVLNDFDEVELSNLQRQVIHSGKSVGEHKTHSATQRLRELNPDCQVTELAESLSEEQLTKQANKADAVVDCSDNFPTRHLLNKVCCQTKTPLVSAAAIRFEGQLTVFHYQDENDACYQCLYPDVDLEQETCTENGVLAPLVGVMGSLQAVEVIKLICSVGETLRNRLLLYDGLNQQFQTMTFKKDPQCPVCRS